MSETASATIAREAQTLTVEVARDELVDALTFAGVGIHKRAQLPVLTGVKISAESGRATVEGFDYETHAVQVIGAQGSGVALVPWRVLLDVAKGCDKGSTLTLAVNGDNLDVTDTGGKFTVALLPLDEYPNAPLPASLPVGTLDRTTLAGIATICGAAGRDLTLPVLTGVCFDPSEGAWTAATTDRYRLGVYDTGMAAADSDARVMVPCGAVLDAAKRLRGDVTMTYAPGSVTFTDGTRTLTARTLDGNFPDYRKLLPDTFTAELVVNAARAVKATKRAALVCSRTAPVIVVLDSDGATVTAGVEDEATATAPAGGFYTGEPMRVGVNPDYLLDMIAGIGSDTVTVGFTSAVKPFVAFDSERPALRWLQMPCRLSS